VRAKVDQQAPRAVDQFSAVIAQSSENVAAIMAGLCRSA